MNTTLKYFVSFLLLVAAPVVNADELRMELEQTFAGSPRQFTRVQPGDEVTLELSATNVGEALGTGVILRYTWPEGLDIVDIVPSPAAAVTVQPDSRIINWHVGELFPATAGSQSIARLQLTGRVRHAVAGKTLHGDLIVVASDQPTSWVSKPPPAFGVAGIASVDLSVAVAGSFSQSGAFYNITYNVTVANAGPETAAEVFLALEVDPITADYIENATLTGPVGSTCDVNLPGCIYMNLNSGESIAFTATGQVLVDDGPINIPITFVVATNDVDTDTTNDRMHAQIALPAPPDDGGGGAVGGLLLTFLALMAVLSPAASRRRVSVQQSPTRPRRRARKGYATSTRASETFPLV